MKEVKSIFSTNRLVTVALVGVAMWAAVKWAPGFASKVGLKA